MKTGKIARDLQRAYDNKCRKERLAFILLIVCGSLFSFFIMFLLDYLTTFPAVIRIPLTILNLGFFYWYLPKQHKRKTVIKKNIIDIAKEVEQKATEMKTGGFYSILVSATEFMNKNINAGSKELRQRVVKEAHRAKYDPEKITLYNKLLITRSRKILLGCAIIYIVWGAFGYNSMMKFYGRAIGLNLRYVSRTRIVAIDCPPSIARFEDLTVRLTAKGILPSKGTMTVRYEGESPFTIPVTPESKESTFYNATIEKPAKNFSFYINLGDDKSPKYNVKVIHPPFIQSGSVTINSPKYTGLPSQTIDLGSFQLLRASTFNIKITPNKKVKSCVFVANSRSVTMTYKNNAYTLSNVSAKEPRTFSIQLIDEYGIENTDRLSYSVNVVPDRVPVVIFKKPEHDAFFAPQSVLRWSFQATDDLGMNTATLKYSINHKKLIGDQGEVIQEATEIRSGELKIADLNGARDVSLNGVINLKDLGVKPDQTADLYISITDNCNMREKDEQASSKIKTINIVTREELQRIITEELLGVHMMVKDINEDMVRQEKKLNIKIKAENKK